MLHAIDWWSKCTNDTIITITLTQSGGRDSRLSLPRLSHLSIFFVHLGTYRHSHFLPVDARAISSGLSLRRVARRYGTFVEPSVTLLFPQALIWWACKSTETGWKCLKSFDHNPFHVSTDRSRHTLVSVSLNVYGEMRHHIRWERENNTFKDVASNQSGNDYSSGFESFVRNRRLGHRANL